MKSQTLKASELLPSRPLLKRPMVWLPLLLLAIYSVYRVLNVYMFPIEKLYITGRVEHIMPELIKQVAMEKIGYGFFAVDLDEIRTALEEMRWVQSVSVRRVWPNALQIDIEEHKAVARWGQIYLINERGNLFIPDNIDVSDDSDKSNELPSLIGPPGMHRYLWGQFSELQSMLSPTGLQISQLVFDSRHAMRLKTRSGISIQLGRLRDVTDNYSELSLFAKAYRQQLKDKQANIVSIDLRYTNGFAIEWRDKEVSSIQQHENLT